jgi:DNA mismatch repair ATPase MutS
LLDVLLSFANLIHNVDPAAGSFTRPSLTKDRSNQDFISLQASKHPITALNKQKDAARQSLVPNNCYLSPCECLQIVTGANGSGKVGLHMDD